MRKRAKPGDIFVEKLKTGHYMFGRVLMDIKEQCFKTKLVEKDVTNLRHVSICYLIEAYDTINDTSELPTDYNIVIKGICVDDMAFEDDVWQVIGNIPVDPSTIDFEEQISYYNKE
ncbi:Imm26 family immunity protein, partial [Fluviicola chungangensis]